MKDKNSRTSAAFAGAGMCLGTALGVALENMGLIFIGIAAGLALAAVKNKKGKSEG